MRRPSSLLLLFPLLALGIRVGSRGPFSPRLLAAVFLLLAGAWLYAAYRGRPGNGLFRAALCAAALLIGQVAMLPEQAWVVPREGEFSGRVYAVQPLSFDQRVLVQLHSSAHRVAVHLPLQARVAVGDELTFRGTVVQPAKAPNPGVFCYRSYLRRLGVFGVSYPPEFVIARQEKMGLLERVRAVLRRNVTAHVRHPGLVLALVLGERDQLGDDRRETWRLLGISHLLAISGMHVGYLALGVSWVMGRLPWRPWLKYLILQCFLFMYIVVSGTGASAWRAFLVSALGGYAGIRGLRRDALHIWAAAGWTLLLLKPAFAFDLGFLLSFAASGGILLWGPTLRLGWKRRIPAYLVQSLLLSTAAQLALAPFLLGSFGEVALLGPVATLLFLPCTAVLLVVGLLTALGLGFLGLGRILNGVMGVVGALEAMLLPYARQWTLGTLTLPEVVVWWLFFIYAGWRLRLPRVTKPRQTYIQLLSMFVVLCFFMSLPPAVRRPLEVTALNVGQGDSFFLRTPSGRSILIDGGGDWAPWQPGGRDVGAQRVVPYLRHRQVERLDYVILSHPHDDHLGGLLAVLEAFPVGLVVDNGDSHTSPTYERYLDLLAAKDIPYRVVRAGDRLDLGDGITLTVLYPGELRPNLPAAQNNNSLLFKVEYGGMRLLFTGDLEAPVLWDLAHDPDLDLRAQWLKIPHHGSRGSLVEEFYQAVDPNWAVIPVGPNPFGHPHGEVLAALEARGISWRTTEEGPVTFEVWWGVWGRFRRSAS